jgi:glycosyltransferase involved in cell wall biosynthesis
MVNILLSAFACDPKMGSEPYVGWNWALILSSKYNVHVITRKHHKLSIQSTSNLPHSLKFHYFDLPFLSRLDHRSKFIKPYYVFWQICVLLKVLLITYAAKIDIIHHITYNNIDLPGFLHLIPKIKFVWGPIGGGQIPNIVFKNVYDYQWKKEIIRKYLKYFARYNPNVLLAINKASLLFFANEETERIVSSLKTKKKVFLLETGIHSKSISNQVRSIKNKNPLLFGWIGHIVPRKALKLAIESFYIFNKASSNHIDSNLVIVGDGPDALSAKNYVAQLGISDKVTFTGPLPYKKMANLYKQLDILIFSSVQDTSGNVIIEALSSGIPVVALNHQGPKQILKNGGGKLVSISNYENTCLEIAKNITKIVFTNGTYSELSQMALLNCFKLLTWQKKSTVIYKYYDEIFSSTKDFYKN